MTNETMTAIEKGDQHTAPAVLFDQTKLDLLKRTICKGSTNDEFELFVMRCRNTGLDPFTGQIHAVKRWDSSQRCEVMAIQVGIDGFRVQAERTGKFNGYLGTWWCGDDGVWKEVWISGEPPMAAKVAVLRKDWAQPAVGIALYSDYVQLSKDRQPMAMWAKMAAHMLAKCAEALALRKAFPNDLCDQHTPEEIEAMNQPAIEAVAAEKPVVLAGPDEIAYIELLAKQPALVGDDRVADAILRLREHQDKLTLEQAQQTQRIFITQLRKSKAPIPPKPSATELQQQTEETSTDTGSGDDFYKEFAFADREDAFAAFHALGVEVHGQDWDKQRRQLVKKINPDRASSKDLTDAELKEAMDRLTARRDNAAN